jgi:hypothetical protein
MPAGDGFIFLSCFFRFFYRKQRVTTTNHQKERIGDGANGRKGGRIGGARLPKDLADIAGTMTSELRFSAFVDAPAEPCPACGEDPCTESDVIFARVWLSFHDGQWHAWPAARQPVSAGHYRLQVDNRLAKHLRKFGSLALPRFLARYIKGETYNFIADTRPPS